MPTSSYATVVQREPPEFLPKSILRVLVEHDVDFVLVGGLAGMAHGSSYPSFDVDIAYGRGRTNLERLASALRELEATLRGAPPDVPFELDADTLEASAHFTFSTPFGALDILDRPDGAPPYEQMKSAAIPTEIEGEPVLVASLDHLIAMKERAGRAKDKLMATEYRILSDELRAPPD